jgi:hypothetical protein
MMMAVRKSGLLHMTQSSNSNAPHAATGIATWRAIIFFLAATSIWCLLVEMYGLCSMRLFTFWVLIPSTVALYALAFWDRTPATARSGAA